MHTAYWYKSDFSVMMCLSRHVDSLVSRLRKTVAQDCVKVSPGFAVVFQITSNNWRKKKGIFSAIGYTLWTVVRDNLDNCSEPRRNFYTVLWRKIWGGFRTLPFEVWKLWTIFLTCDVRLLLRKVVNQIRQTTWLATLLTLTWLNLWTWGLWLVMPKFLTELLS